MFMTSQKSPGKSPYQKKMKATKVPEKSTVNRQPTKLMSSLKRIAKIDLSDEKVKLFENSRFASLISITNARESSSTLVEALALSYSSEKQSFLINEEKFSFCPKEVADVLGISILDTETDYDVFKEKSKQFSGKYPDSLYKLHEEINKKPKKQMTTEDLKELVVKMSVEEEQNKTLFVQLLSYYYVERFLLCSSDHHLRKTLWNFVCDMKAFDSVNWAKEIHAHLMKSISALHGHLKFGDHKKQFNFQGCAPVLEAILFERMPKLCPNVKTLEPPLVQKYCSVRKTIEDWKKSFLTCEITPCLYCSNTSTPVYIPIRTIPLIEEVHEAMTEGLSALKISGRKETEGRKTEEEEAEGSPPMVGSHTTPMRSPIRAMTFGEDELLSEREETEGRKTEEEEAEGSPPMVGSHTTPMRSPIRAMTFGEDELLSEREGNQEPEPEKPELEKPEPDQESEPQPLRRSKRNIKAPTKYASIEEVGGGRGRRGGSRGRGKGKGKGRVA